MNEAFLFNSIHKYNRATRQSQKDVLLYKMGVHAGLIEKRRSPLPTLTPEQRQSVINFVNDFLKSQGFSTLIQ
jgi:hypothetical protein